MNPIDAEQQARVRAALAQLPADQRQIIELTLFAGLTQRALVPLGRPGEAGHTLSAAFSGGGAQGGAARLHCAEADVPKLARLALRTLQALIEDSP